MNAQSMWIHGNNMQIEYPERLNAIRRAASYIDVDGKPGTNNWFHFAIPSPVIVNNEAMRTAAIFLRFRSRSSDAYIKEVHLYDGEKKFMEFNDLNLAPSEFDVIRFDPPLYEIQFGLGVSLYIVFGVDTSSHRMEFSSAGCNFVGQLPDDEKGPKSKNGNARYKKARKLKNRS